MLLCHVFKFALRAKPASRCDLLMRRFQQIQPLHRLQHLLHTFVTCRSAVCSSKRVANDFSCSFFIWEAACLLCERTRACVCTNAAAFAFRSFSRASSWAWIAPFHQSEQKRMNLTRQQNIDKCTPNTF